MAAGSGRRGGSSKRGDRAYSRFWPAAVWGFILFLLLFVFPLPYFIFKPGSAEVLGPMVHTKTEAKPVSGQFLLTTVGVKSANAAGLVAAKLKGEEIRTKKAVLGTDSNEDEYNQRQEYNMMSSQSNAIQAAYKKAGIPYTIQGDGVLVLHVQKGMPAAQVLQVGDLIIEADGQTVRQPGDLTSRLKGKQAGDRVALAFKRKEETKRAEVTLGVIPSPSPSPGASPAPSASPQGGPSVGIGITLGSVQSVQPHDESKKVTVSAGDIGGPSAGLMFSLEIYNRLVAGDITKGYRIAGTGEIDPEGHVGVIGGIKYKVMAADREKAEIFFAPADWTSPNGQTLPNYSEAAEQARKIGTTMKVVPVKTMQDALDYLSKLPSKAEKPAA